MYPPHSLLFSAFSLARKQVSICFHKITLLYSAHPSSSPEPEAPARQQISGQKNHWKNDSLSAALSVMLYKAHNLHPKFVSVPHYSQSVPQSCNPHNLFSNKKTDHITTLYALSFYSYKSSCSFTSLLSAMHCFKAMIIFSASSGFAR